MKTLMMFLLSGLLLVGGGVLPVRANEPLGEELRDEFSLRVRMLKLAGVGTKSALGHSDSVDTTLDMLYHGHASGTSSFEALVATPSTVKVSSTSANDDVGNSGATVVRLSGLDENNAAVSENVSMDGQTAVTTTTVWKVVEKMQVIAGAPNVGTVWAGNGTVTAGVPATKYNAIEIGTGVSAACILGVPAGKSSWCGSSRSIPGTRRRC